MPRFSANISMLFTEHDFLDRFRAAREAGFEAVEFLFPYDHPVEAMGDAVRSNGLDVSVFNLSPGNWESGDRGLGCLAERQDEFRQSVETALAYAAATGAKRCHVMAGNQNEVSRQRARSVFLDNLRYASEKFAAAGLEILIEPLNGYDMPGYFLSSTDMAVDILAEIDRPNVGLQFDIYHHQIMHGDVVRSLERHMPFIRHIQIASVPHRREPDEGELNYSHVFEQLDVLGYDGWVGCEYRPRAGTLQGLEWMRA
ncbi:MAG: hydroxypyruvate isomerase family protein [Hyphomicrobiales bacterium]|nr:hydroxypyruvate isomerase family protein [Hyphomicrobiales bacterium]MCP5002155.1 hydroxypyruvate isomerase family protein [Hyphomicrobiales bacterium]